MKKSLAEHYYQEASKTQAKAIRKIANRLCGIKAHFEPLFRVDLTDLAKLRKDLEKRNWKGKSGVYLFYADPRSVSVIQKALERYRLRQLKKENLSRRRAVPCPNLKARARYGCLYVGMSAKGNLHRRLIEHIFNSSARTGSLKLSRWAANLKPQPKIWIEVLVFDDGDKDCIRDIEKGYWAHFEPAIGER